MSMFDFDMNDVSEDTGGDFELMPNGEYTFMATEAEAKPTKAGTGSYLAVTFEVLTEGYVGRKVWMNFTLNNPSQKAQDIGRGQIKAWSLACGLVANDSDQLLNQVFQGVMGVEKGTGGYADKNTIKKFLPKAGAVAAAPVAQAAAPVIPPTPPAVTQPATEAAATGGNPWD